jgi:copper chaperone
MLVACLCLHDRENEMKLHVPDMTCNHCVSSITKAIKELSSDAHVVCDLHDHVVEVANLVETMPDKVIAALDEIGFEATLLEAEA